MTAPPYPFADGMTVYDNYWGAAGPGRGVIIDVGDGAWYGDVQVKWEGQDRPEWTGPRAIRTDPPCWSCYEGCDWTGVAWTCRACGATHRPGEAHAYAEPEGDPR